MTVPETSRSRAPVPADSVAFHEGLEEGRFLTQTCGACGGARFYPRLVCPTCGSTESRWVDGQVDGVVHSHSTIHRAVYPSGPQPPYQVVWAEMDSGARFIAVADVAAPMAIDERVRLVIQTVGQRQVPTFRRPDDHDTTSHLSWPADLTTPP